MPDPTTQLGARVHITGIVQGVGFRPFVYALAKRLGLTGWVRNTSAGVEIEIDGYDPEVHEFIELLQKETPSLARIDQLNYDVRLPAGYTDFEIVLSEALSGAFQPISPDVSICPDCLEELFDPKDRRFRYPFINCTNCGPRLTIIRDIPYDRPKTTMAIFPMCPECRAEYLNPLDRRFHAQPVACPVCGPHVWLEIGDSGSPAYERELALQQAQELLRDGIILAIKGLGGFHLACDATNPNAVAELRRRKQRVDKPFALMAFDIETISAHCQLSPADTALLERRERPIVICHRRADSPIAAQTAPGQGTLGFMLPYTPLHYLLLSGSGIKMPPLVMTSGNLSEEPICTDNEEAREHLGKLADAFLMHNRDIHVRCDDSVVRMFPALGRELSLGKKTFIYPLRRARGFAPDPLLLQGDAPPLLTVGAELKNTFCLARQRYAFLSHHIGDLENYETLHAFEQGIEHYEHLFRIKPELIGYDLHPNYLATRYAMERAERQGLTAVPVQHHHAHIAACMAENGLNGETPVIGVSFDGTGYGEDGAIWGGEFLLANYIGFQRLAHLRYVPLPGGDLAAREPWRIALAWLQAAGIGWEEDLPPVRHAARLDTPLPQLDILRRQLHSRVNSPLTSSMGRLFDAVSALLGIRQVVNYEAQAAIEMEALVDRRETTFYEVEYSDGIIDPAPLLRGIATDLQQGETIPVLAGRFHNSLAQAVLQVCTALREQTGVNQVALSGGVWQNMHLLALTIGLLQQSQFEIFLHRQVPANDGGLALGQAVIAIAKAKK